MSEWKETNLFEIIELIGGGTPMTSVPEYWNGDIPWLSVADFNNGLKYVFETEKTITTKGLINSSTNILNKGDIIISARGTVGVVAVLGKKMTFNQSCYGIRANRDFTVNDYIYYLLKDTVSSFNQIAHGGVFDTITRDTFKEIKVSLPSLPEQVAIASVLSSLDDKIDLLQRQNATLEKMAETLFRQWFVEEAKEEWEGVELGSVVETTSGGTPSRTNIEFYENGTISWVKSKELKGSFIHETEEKITEEALKKSSAKILPAHSVLIAMYGATVGEYAIISKEMTCNQAICALKPNKDYPYSYLFLLIKSNKEELINMAVGSAQQNISQLLIKQLPVLNCTGLIKEFNFVIEPYFEKIKSNQYQICTLTALCDTMLPKLMNGEVTIEM